MTSSPDLIQELRASRPAAPPDLRARVREIAAQEAAAVPSPFARLRRRLPERRLALVALPAAATLALATAGVVGLARSDAPTTEAFTEQLAGTDKATPESTVPEAATPPVTSTLGSADADRSGVTPADDR